MIFPIGEYAFRTNLLTALFASAAAGFWFLVLYVTIGNRESGIGNRLPILADASGALIAAFTFSNWLNSNETEVYAVSAFAIAATTWFMFRWRAHRGTPRARRYLLLAGYLLGLAVGNHLLGLLAGPAIVAFMVAELIRHRSSDLLERKREWGDAGMMAGVWALLVGVGLGSPTLALGGGVAVLAALGYAARQRGAGFGLALIGIALVGVTPYLFLYLRAAQHPAINEADPSTWQALFDVIRRAQYPMRTPLDDPTFLHEDPANPGRGLRIILLQLANYLQYFDWQWANGIRATLGALPVRSLFTLGFGVLGVRGMLAQWRSDRSGAWLLLTLFLTTGLGLVAYMNFKPGYSLGYNWYPDGTQHEVRERDYFFVISFIVWGLWAGLGLLGLARSLAARARPRAAALVLLLGVVPFALNFPVANRRFGPDARLPGDFAYDLLNSVPPYGILFTYGDNDTFPLWWAQEVAGIRRDVTVICLALAETDWYMRQLRDNPVRPFDEGTAPAIWKGRAGPRPGWPVHSMTDQEIAAAVPQILSRDVELEVGPHRVRLPGQSVLYAKDFLTLRVIQQNFGRRPIVWALTAGGKYYGLDHLVLQQGLGLAMQSEPVDTTSSSYDLTRLMGAPLDVPTTERLVTETYRYAGLLKAGNRIELETTAAGIASTLGLPSTQLALAAESRADTASMTRHLERAAILTRNPALRARVDSIRPGSTPGSDPSTRR
jgi:F0F1-type ATP synthase membrane subunit c/vacuolar-type H+-ATPase subunit K